MIVTSNGTATADAIIILTKFLFKFFIVVTFKSFSG